MVNDTEIMLELAHRAGFLEDVYTACNMVWKLPPDYALELDKRYTYQEMVDRFLKAQHGPDKGLDWYMEDGLEVYDRSLQERYPGAYPKPRVHLYHEYMIEAGHQVEAVTGDLGIPWETSDYIPLAEWRPCAAHTPKSPEYDLYLITAKVPYHALTFTGSNPLLQEVGDQPGLRRDQSPSRCGHAQGLEGRRLGGDRDRLWENGSGEDEAHLWYSP